MTSRKASAWVIAFAFIVLAAYELIDTGEVSDPLPETPTAQGELRPPDSNGDSPDPVQFERARVLRVVDGDTILVRRLSASPDTRAERVRYIGVDTPESVKPNSPVECFGKQASDYNAKLVEGKTVRLEPDIEPLDRYGRTLAFVYVEGTLVNAKLLSEGFAQTIEIKPNVSKAKYFTRVQLMAKRTNKGLWGACDR
ncbi:MAG: thermonuclease family protein [Solirubrobacterales bacterium]